MAPDRPSRPDADRDQATDPSSGPEPVEPSTPPEVEAEEVWVDGVTCDVVTELLPPPEQRRRATEPPA